MNFRITQLVKTVLLHIDGTFVAAYDSIEEVELVINAYKGN
jgi:hypothetical protein